jgi:hypothetical protein
MALNEGQRWSSGLSRVNSIYSLIHIVHLLSKKEMRRNSGSQKGITIIKGAPISLLAARFSYVVVL